MASFYGGTGEDCIIFMEEVRVARFAMKVGVSILCQAIMTKMLCFRGKLGFFFYLFGSVCS